MIGDRTLVDARLLSIRGVFMSCVHDGNDADMLGGCGKIVFSKMAGVLQQQDDPNERGIRIRLCVRPGYFLPMTSACVAFGRAAASPARRNTDSISHCSLEKRSAHSSQPECFRYWPRRPEAATSSAFTVTR